MSRLVPLGILISGRGSNMSAILDAINRGDISATCNIVISHNPQADGLSIARQHNVLTDIISYADYPNTLACEHAITQRLQECGVQLVILAGFMRLLKGPLLSAYPHRILNIHPSLLPKHKGLRAQAQALDAGDTISGCTVHVVTPDMDTGPIVMQSQVPMFPDDTEQTLSDRILSQEHQLYPAAIQTYIKEGIHAGTH